ncbi:hypothetical protein CRV02_02180 [Arcobacter sp. CECT 8989]|uniref:hypothetical protein n=1 Tax=Arcobacter sp. CECT 8989 TaxID=2044509 RepID=UPI00100A86EF|nr:hypothetical protein [Arcobacter sp. CECT 8989]RXK04023.1 hypothetical protein CRV02_02180 [Arcobacter sp. CECT 8989]
MLKSPKDSHNYIQKIEKVLKEEKVREQLTINELSNTNTNDKNHIKSLKNYLEQIKTNILKLNYLLDNLNMERNITSLSIAKLAQQDSKIKSYL